MSKHLPILLERTIAEAQATRTLLEHKYAVKARHWASEQGRPITCYAGCSSCCYHPILVSILEGFTIYQYLVREGRWTTQLKKALQETSDRQYGVDYSVWLLSLTPCVFLGPDKRCSIYPIRPYICHVYRAVSDPHYCHPHRLGPETALVPREAALQEHQAEEARLLLRHKIKFAVIPVGAAVLLADRLTKGEISVEDIDRIVFQAYQTQG